MIYRIIYCLLYGLSNNIGFPLRFITKYTVSSTVYHIILCFPYDYRIIYCLLYGLSQNILSLPMQLFHLIYCVSPISNNCVDKDMHIYQHHRNLHPCTVSHTSLHGINTRPPLQSQ